MLLFENVFPLFFKLISMTLRHPQPSILVFHTL